MHYIGRIQYWANAIRPYNYPPVSVRAYRIRPFAYAQNYIITLLHYYIITTLHVMFFWLVVWFGFCSKTQNSQLITTN